MSNDDGEVVVVVVAAANKYLFTKQLFCLIRALLTTPGILKLSNLFQYHIFHCSSHLSTLNWHRLLNIGM